MNTLDSLVRDGLLPDSMLVRPIREVWIAIRSDGPADTDPLNPQIIGEGTRENPWDGSTARRFDKILNLSVTIFLRRLSAALTLISLSTPTQISAISMVSRFRI